MIRPGLCSVTLRGMPPDAVIGVAAEAGLEAIEWGADVHVPGCGQGGWGRLRRPQSTARLWSRL